MLEKRINDSAAELSDIEEKIKNLEGMQISLVHSVEEETTSQLREQAQKASSVLAASAQELPARGVIAVTSAAMLAFYAYVYLSDINPPKEIESGGPY
ncbi:unnamed protein product [Sphagnum tenellum]